MGEDRFCPVAYLQYSLFRAYNNANSVRSSVLDEVRMKPGQWFGLVICVSFSVLTLLVVWVAALFYAIQTHA